MLDIKKALLYGFNFSCCLYSFLFLSRLLWCSRIPSYTCAVCVNMTTPSHYWSKKPLSSRARQIVLFVQEYFCIENYVNATLHPLYRVQQRTAAACSVSLTTVKRIAQKQPWMDEYVYLVDLHEFTKSAIRRHVYNYYARTEHPTLTKLLNSLVQADLFHGSCTSLRTILCVLGFRFKKKD